MCCLCISDFGRLRLAADIFSFVSSLNSRYCLLYGCCIILTSGSLLPVLSTIYSSITKKVKHSSRFSSLKSQKNIPSSPSDILRVIRPIGVRNVIPQRPYTFKVSHKLVREQNGLGYHQKKQLFENQIIASLIFLIFPNEHYPIDFPLTTKPPCPVVTIGPLFPRNYVKM